ncbi:histidine phosphatase family protein [Mangrovicella endophytica]|uniref:histidine phosphatase family protein n=1 Tax=Mangrovicella endophytica TaxID=2066697 RepID=UPI000C9DD256|nr:histidine phosphatase family protein [Mangrovicella endophytica]
MSLPTLYLCRHGQTDWNAEGRIQGQRDIPLNDLGRTQAARNGRYLKETLGDAAASFRYVASPLGRTQETMRILRREIGLDPADFELDPRLVELHFGDWQGWTLRELKERDSAGIAARRRDKWNFLPPGDGAESYERLATRVRPVFESLDGPTIMVAHGGVSRAFLRLYCGVSPADAAQAGIEQDRILTLDEGRAAWV